MLHPQNMSAFRRYSAALLALYGAVAAAVIGFGLTTPPYVGDLTRLGGYREDSFGWRAPQLRYQPPLYVTDRIEADTDVLVLGDSMTVHRSGEQTDNGTYWPNWLAAETGWRISALHRNEHTVEEVLAMPDYQAHRPKLLILEFVERAISGLDRLTDAAAHRYGCGVSEPSGQLPVAAPLLGAVAASTAQPRSFFRSEPAQPWLDFSIGGHRLKHELLRRLVPDLTETASFTLTRADLFSNAQPQTLLVLREDLAKIDFPEQRLQRLDCGLRALQQEVQADGRTRFVVMIVPDKLSAYRPYVRQLPEHYPNLIAQLARDTPLVLPRMDLAFDLALAAGTQDLFLPNDSHIGAAGHRLVAETLLSELRRRGLIGD